MRQSSKHVRTTHSSGGLLLLVWTLAFSLVPLSCVGTDVGNPPSVPDDAQLSLALVATSSDATVAGPVRVGDVWIDSAGIGLGDLKLANGSGKLGTSLLEAPVAFNPLTGQTSSDTSITLSPGPYRSMVLTLRPLDPAPIGFPGELADSSVVIEGRRPDGSPFILIAALTEPIWLSAATTFQVRGGSHTLFIRFAVERWFVGEQLSELTDSSERIIDSSNSPDLVEHFSEALAASATLVQDSDDDGALDLSVDQTLAKGGRNNEEDDEREGDPSEGHD